MECGVRAVREALSSQYLDWALIVGGMRKARKIYHRWFSKVYMTLHNKEVSAFGRSVCHWVEH